MTQAFTTILLIGEGALVKQLGRCLLKREHSVWGCVSSEALAPGMARLGINPVVADLTDPYHTKIAVSHADIIYHLAARRSHGSPAPEPTDLKALQTILSVLPSQSARRYIFESGLAVYDGLSGEAIDEKAICRPKSATGRILLEAEREILSRFSQDGFPGIILRSASLYQSTPGIYDQIRKGSYSIPPGLPPILHRIYLEDYLDILVAMMEKGRIGQIYNVTDQAPHPPEAHFHFMATALGAPPSAMGGNPADSVGGPRFQNEKLLKELNRTLRFPTFREGVTDGIKKAESGNSVSF